MIGAVRAERYPRIHAQIRRLARSNTSASPRVRALRMTLTRATPASLEAVPTQLTLRAGGSILERSEILTACKLATSWGDSAER